MEVYVKMRDKSSTVELDEDSTISCLLERLEINRETVLVMVNQEIRVEEEMLKQGDEVEIIMAVSGG
ncbi:MAG: MoaD/ThiS family protein [Candidatus Hydrothermarchaeales archaeon]